MRVLISVATLLFTTVPAVGQATLQWGAPAAQNTASDPALEFRPDGGTLSVIFDRFIADAQNAGAPMTVTRAATFTASVTGAASTRPLRFTQDLRGVVEKGPDARVVIVAVLPDRTETIVFPYGRAMTGEHINRRITSRLRYRQGQQYTASFFVRVDRRSPDAVGHVTLDTFDVQVSQARR